MKIDDEIKQQRFTSNKQKAVINLLYTANWLIAKQKDLFRPYNVTVQQFNILRILRGNHPRAISATEIKSRMLDRNSDVSRLIDRMLSKGLVTRKTSTSDKRAADIHIAEAGIALLAEMDKVQDRIDNMIDLDETNAGILNELLDAARG